MDCFQAAAEAAPSDTEVWRWLATVRRRLGDIAGAVEAWRRVLVLSPDEWEARNDLGTALMEANAFEERRTSPSARLSPAAVIRRWWR